MLERGTCLEYIEKVLSEWSTRIIYENSIRNYNLAKISEELIKNILNIVDNLNLKSENILGYESSIFDLIDYENKIIYQVTSNESSEKLKNTLKMYKENKKLSCKFKLNFFILSNKKYQKKTIMGLGLKKENIITFTNLFQKICALEENDDIFKIFNYMSNSPCKVDNIIKCEELKAELQKSKFLTTPYINRNFLIENNQKDISLYDWNNYSKPLKHVLLNNTGEGKTVALKIIYDKINDSDNKFAYLYFLKNYEGEDIENLIPREYDCVDSKNFFILLDGFDEVSLSQKKRLLKKIETYISKNKKTNIIISSRKNYSEHLSEYIYIKMEKYSEYQIIEYLKHKNISLENLRFRYKNINIEQELYIPFYLEILCTLYKDNVHIENKSDIVETYAEHLIKRDIKKEFCSSFDIEYEIYKKLLINASLKVFENHGNCINSLDFARENNIEYNKLLKISFFEVNGDELNFQNQKFYDFFLAQYFLNVTDNEVKQKLLNGKKIVNDFKEITGFLIYKKSDSNISQYILKNNIEMLVYSTNLEHYNEKRFKVFWQTIRKYIRRDIWIPYHIYTDIRFLNLINCTLVYDYLIKVVENNSSRVNTINCLNILVQLSELKSNNSVDYLLKIEKVIFDERYDARSKRRAYNLLANLSHENSNLYDESMEKKINTNAYLRAGFYDYIIKLNLVDNKLNFILSKLKNRFEYTNRNVLVDESIAYDELYKYFRNKKSIYTVKDKIIMEEFVYNVSPEIIKNFIISVEKTFSFNEQKKLIFEMYKKFNEFVNKECITLLKNIILEKSLKKEFIIYLLQNYIEEIYLFDFDLDDDFLKIFLEYCDTTTIPQKYFRQVLDCMYQNDLDISMAIKKYEDKFKEKYILLYAKYSDKKKKEREKIFLEGLFNKKQFLKNVENLISIMDNKQIDLKKILQSNRYYDRDPLIKNMKSHLHFYRNKYENIITLNNYNEFVDIIFNNEFLIPTMVRLIQAKKFEIILTEKQSKILLSKCLNLIKDIKIETIEEEMEKYITYYGNGYTISENWIELYILWYHFNLFLPEQILLQFLKIYPVAGIWNDVLEKLEFILGEQILIKKIAENITNKKVHGFVLKAHVEYLYSKKIFHYSENILLMYNDENIDEYIRMSFLPYIFESSDEEVIKKLLLSLPIEKNSLLEHTLNYINENRQFSNYYNRYLIPKIKGINSKIWDDFILEYQLKNKNLRALKKYYVKINNEKETVDKYNVIIKSYNKLNGIMLLFKMLKEVLSENIKDTRFSSLSNCIEVALVNMANRSNSNKVIVKILVNLFIKKNKKIKNVNFLYYVILRINGENYY